MVKSDVQQRKKIFIVLLVLNTVINSTLSSALPSGISTLLAEAFDIDSEEELVLPTSIYILGYVLGPLVFGPLSETIGRRRVMIPTFSGFTIATLACALVRSWAGLVILRFLAGAAASAPITIVGGIYADIYDDPVSRGRAMALFMAVSNHTFVNFYLNR